MTTSDRLSLASTLIDAEQYAKALTILFERLAENPDDVGALCMASRAQLGLGRAEESLALAKRATSLDPGNEWPLRLASVAYGHLGDLHESVRSARAARDLAPHQWQTHLRVAQADINAKTITQDTERAATEALRLAPDPAESHVIVGNLRLAQKRTRAAADAYRDALRIDPQNTVARNNLALAMLRRGRPGTAVTAFMSLLADNPESRRAVYNLRISVGAGLRRAHLVLYFAVALVYLSHSFGPLGSLFGTASVARKWLLVALAVLAVTVVASFVIWMRRTAGSRFAVLVRAAPRLDPLLVVWIALLACCATLMVVAAVLPRWSDACYDANFAIILASVLVSASRSRKLAAERASL